MFKKITALVLAAAMLFTLAACSKGSDKIIKPEKKVAVLVAPESEYPEDYMAAKAIEEKYPKNVVVMEYSDSRILKSGDGPIITTSQKAAQDDSIGAIVYARATMFTVEAILKAKEINPDIITVAIEPEDSLTDISQYADLVLCCDMSAAASEIVSTAKAMGAENFVFMTTKRAMENELIAKRSERFESICKNQAVNFIIDYGYDATDGMVDGSGIEKAKDVADERITFLKSKGKINENTVLFSTDCTVQPALAKIANENGMIYICPEFPGVYGAAGTAFEIANPIKFADTASYIKSVKNAVKESGGTGRFAYYDYTLMKAFVYGAVYCAFDMLNGSAAVGNLSYYVKNRMNYAADNENFSVSGDGNVFYAYCSGCFVKP